MEWLPDTATIRRTVRGSMQGGHVVIENVLEVTVFDADPSTNPAPLAILTDAEWGGVAT